jgi:hypothetical protein
VFALTAIQEMFPMGIKENTMLSQKKPLKKPARTITIYPEGV